MDWNLEESLSYYKKMGAPSDQNAVIQLLREVQRTFGSIPASLIPQIAVGLGTKEALLQALIRRIPSLRLDNTHTLELCGGPNCGKARALVDFAAKACSAKPVKLKFVPCMRMCGKGPNLRWDGQLHHKADEKLIAELLKTL
jgi:NADH:ubiquinone oxidoreductase subunit E